MIRNNLREPRPRCHYNKSGQTKQTFDTEKEAKNFIKKLHLLNYSVYQCKLCNKYHVSHK